MEKLREKFYRKLNATSTNFVRSLMEESAWDARLIGVKGARGVGKTTLMLQYIKLHVKANESVLYVSLDDLWFADNKLTDFTEQFVKEGGRFLFLDEVHKYPNWSQEIKNIYDDFPDLQIVFTGSSLLEILNARADLSRRAVVYNMQGLSYREYLNLTQKKQLPAYTLNEILQKHSSIAQQITKHIKPLQFFKKYLESGYYPFFKEMPELYHHRIEEVSNLILEIELPLIKKVDMAYVTKLKQLLQIIAESVPFVPNVSKLSERIGINRNTLITYLFFLQEAHLTRNVYKNASGITQLQKPDKLYLENTNLAFTFGKADTDTGNRRETFFANQLGYKHRLEYTDEGDFKINRKYIFEIGGKNKTKKQIKAVKNNFVVRDDLEIGSGNTIPLWLFGFLY